MTKENITIYIDAANLILGIRNFFQIELDMYQLCLYFQERYRANKCIYFTAKIPGLVNEFDKLKTCGVEIVFKEMYFENRTYSRRRVMRNAREPIGLRWPARTCGAGACPSYANA